jgi:hypothetical protein
MDMDFVKELGTALQSEVAPGKKMRSIDKEDYRENLGIIASRIKTLIDTLSIMPANMKQSLADQIYKATSDRANVACNLYVAIAKAIGKNDLRIAFDSILMVATTYSKIFESLERTTNMTFKDKMITVYNSKLSHVAIFGVIGEAELFVNYATYLFDNVTYELCANNGVRELPAPKQYRMAFLQFQQVNFINLIKNRLQNGANVVISELDKAGRNNDVNLIGDDNTANLGFVQTTSYTPMMRNLFTTGARSFVHVIFQSLGELWNLIKNHKYTKAKKEKEWMEAHVALLKLQLQGVDPNSDEYRKQVQIIESYNEMIAELDQKIAQYENN